MRAEARLSCLHLLSIPAFVMRNVMSGTRTRPLVIFIIVCTGGCGPSSNEGTASSAPKFKTNSPVSASSDNSKVERVQKLIDDYATAVERVSEKVAKVVDKATAAGAAEEMIKGAGIT